MSKNIQSKSVRRLIFMLFIGPGIFFLFYWFIIQSTSEAPPQDINLPEQYYLPGETAQINAGEIKAGDSKTNTLANELLLGNNNRVLAEPGKAFFVIPIAGRNYDFQYDDFTLLDAHGYLSTSLKVEQEDLRRVVQKKNINNTSKSPVHYLVFKVKRDVPGYYLIMNENAKNNKKEIVWYFKE